MKMRSIRFPNDLLGKMRALRHSHGLNYQRIVSRSLKLASIAQVDVELWRARAPEECSTSLKIVVLRTYETVPGKHIVAAVNWAIKLGKLEEK